MFCMERLTKMPRLAPSFQPPRRVMLVLLSLVVLVQLTPPTSAAVAASFVVGIPATSRRRLTVRPRSIPRWRVDPVGGSGVIGGIGRRPLVPRPLPAAASSDAEAEDRRRQPDDDRRDDGGDGAVREVLLRVRFSTPPATGADAALDGLRDYVRSFPFAAVLPVQPLQYLPTDDGVDVNFLRKKTKEKGSEDGGIVISVLEGGEGGLYSAEEDAGDDDDGEDGVAAAATATDDGPSGSLDLVARRNPEGQTISKIFSEKQVVLKLLEGLEEVQSDKGVQIESVFHKWL